MEKEEKICFITNNLKYQGRAMAFYKDGRDYGVVTIMSVKNSAYIISSYTCFVYSEVNHNLIGTCITGGHAGHSAFENKMANCGRKYILTCDTKEGEEIFIGVFF